MINIIQPDSFEQHFSLEHIIYDNGNNYNVTTGGYTAPVDGIYQFSVALRMTGEWSTIEFLVDTRYVRYCETRKGYGTSLAHTSCTITISLKAGQILQTKTGAPGTLQAVHNTAPGLLFPGSVVIFCFLNKFIDSNI